MTNVTTRDFRGRPGLMDGRAVLITGGTGSFGRAMVEKLLKEHTPQRIVVYSRDEHKHYDMQQELDESGLSNINVVRFFIGDVRDQPRLEMAMRKIDTVVHAAALKQVRAAEYNPFECIHTNVLGAENVTRAAMNTGVRRVIALSTDKACAPVSLYGASKLASDKIFIAANALSGRDGCRFSVVRYGNVLGSRGSVVPFFKKLIDQGASALPITDERMTRFWIQLEQGVSFVISCLDMMCGGELFVPKIPSLKVTDLARAMAPSMPHKIVGIRPGEKLHEAMITVDDSRTTIDLKDRYVVLPAAFPFWNESRYIEYDKTPVPEGFEYTSGTNSEWLSADEVGQMLGE